MAQPNHTIEIDSAPQDEGFVAGEDEKFIFNGPTSPPLQDINIGQLLQQQFDLHSERVAVISRWQNISLTYQSIFNASRDLAQLLLLHGVRPGDHVVVLAGNSIEYLQLFFSVGGIGAIFVIINPTFSEEEAIAAIDFIGNKASHRLRAKPKAIFIADRIGFRNNKSLLEQLSSKNQNKSLIVQLGVTKTSPNNVLTWHEFRQVKVGENQHGLDILAQYWARGDPHDTLCIQFTSGTTGPRKASMLSHRNLINNAFLVAERLSFTPDDILCCCPPLFHCFGLVCGPLATFTHGSSAVIPSDVFNADSSLRAMSEENCTAVNAVTTMFQALLDYSQTKALTLKFRLRTGIIAGSSLSGTQLQRLNDEFGLKDLSYGFGMTELSCVSFMTTPSEMSLLNDRSTVGKLMPHTSAKVVDENLRALPPGARGELLVSGYLLFSGYYKNPKKSEEAVVVDSHGRQWLRTGDIVTLSTSGACTVIGRIKDLIKKGGENISPGDVEKVLEQHPDIRSAAVVGIPDSRWGEVIGAFIQRTQDVSLKGEVQSKDVKLWLRSRLAPHKIPDHFFWVGQDGVPDELPINVSGKVLKNELSVIASGLVNGEDVR
ncbi:putative amp dependent CoA ligase [Xylogone sp. PMI_703]|nr:putative amp dependent CoA ligase [Xylogone sp. PMI_703]